MLDLISLSEIPDNLREFYRVLCSNGQLVVLSLTEGINLTSQAIVGAWKLAYSISPVFWGGCRPMELSNLIRETGFNLEIRVVLVQIGVPSEIILASK